jgi:hypothetical protein
MSKDIGNDEKAMTKRQEGDQRMMKHGAGQGKRLACNANG